VEEEQEKKEEGSTNNLTDCELGSDTAKRLQQRIIIIIHGIYGAGLSVTVHAMAALLAYMAFPWVDRKDTHSTSYPFSQRPAEDCPNERGFHNELVGHAGADLTALGPRTDLDAGRSLQYFMSQVEIIPPARRLQSQLHGTRRGISGSRTLQTASVRV
jgi:hypothetical protein